MDDLISRQAAYATALAMYVRCDTGDIEDYRDLMCESILALPPAQPEIIRCKDCKYYRPMIEQDDLCDYRGMQVFPDDYCSRAEPYKGEQECTKKI